MHTSSKSILAIAAIAAVATLAVGGQDSRPSKRLNKVEGLWKPITIQATMNRHLTEPYGPHPDGLLDFNEDLHFVGVIIDPTIPHFKSSTRQGGTGEEAKAAVSGSLGFYGTYTVDGSGEFTGNKVIGSTFPNWNRSVRSKAHLTENVVGDTMTEIFHDGNTEVRIVWRRVS